ncbi:MAG TPA: hypothetical protein VMA09_00450 [Candidatus Binataceae bacterium]|nr:hypothetical protein [Candidatus Binataceae bacterium]
MINDGHKTEAVYRRHAITDTAMLQEAALKLAACTTPKRNAKVTPKWTPFWQFRRDSDLQNIAYLLYFLIRARVAEWQTRWT